MNQPTGPAASAPTRFFRRNKLLQWFVIPLVTLLVLFVLTATFFDWNLAREPIARMMAEGAVENSHAHLSVAITGVAGPDGGTPMKPVGTVHFATARTNHSVQHRMEMFDLDTRWEIQMASVQVALEFLRDRLR